MNIEKYHPRDGFHTINSNQDHRDGTISRYHAQNNGYLNDRKSSVSVVPKTGGVEIGRRKSLHKEKDLSKSVALCKKPLPKILNHNFEDGLVISQIHLNGETFREDKGRLQSSASEKRSSEMSKYLSLSNHNELESQCKEALSRTVSSKNKLNTSMFTESNSVLHPNASDQECILSTNCDQANTWRLQCNGKWNIEEMNVIRTSTCSVDHKDNGYGMLHSPLRCIGSNSEFDSQEVECDDIQVEIFNSGDYEKMMGNDFGDSDNTSSYNCKLWTLSPEKLQPNNITITNDDKQMPCSAAANTHHHNGKISRTSKTKSNKATSTSLRYKKENKNDLYRRPKEKSEVMLKHQKNNGKKKVLLAVEMQQLVKPLNNVIRQDSSVSQNLSSHSYINLYNIPPPNYLYDPNNSIEKLV